MQLSTRLRARPVNNLSEKGNASQFRRFWYVLVPELTVKVCCSDHLAVHRELKQGMSPNFKLSLDTTELSCASVNITSVRQSEIMDG